MRIPELPTKPKVIYIVQTDRCWYLRLPGYLPTVVDALKSLIPYERRHEKNGLGWMADAICWAFDYDDYYPVLQLLRDLMPTTPAEIVEEFPPMDRSIPYE